MRIIKDSVRAHYDAANDESFLTCKVLVMQTKLTVIVPKEVVDNGRSSWSTQQSSNTGINSSSSSSGDISGGKELDASIHATAASFANTKSSIGSSSGSTHDILQADLAAPDSVPQDSGDVVPVVVDLTAVEDAAAGTDSAQSAATSGHTDGDSSTLRSAVDKMLDAATASANNNATSFLTPAAQSIFTKAANRATADPIDSLTAEFTTFTLAPLVAAPIETSYHCGKYVYMINSERKISKICNLFRVSSQPPAFI